MILLTLNQLYAIAKAAFGLDRVEDELRVLGHQADADALTKIQADVGVAVAEDLTDYRRKDPAPGLETGEIGDAYEPVTAERMGVLRAAMEKLPEGESRNHLAALIETLNLEAPAPAGAITMPAPQA